MSLQDPVYLVLCTVPEPDTRRLVDCLLEERHIACANLLGPVESRYRWEGRLETSREILLLMKASSSALEGLRGRIAALHPYEVPEVLEFEASSGLPAYLAWVTASCGAES